MDFVGMMMSIKVLICLISGSWMIINELDRRQTGREKFFFFLLVCIRRLGLLYRAAVWLVME